MIPYTVKNFANFQFSKLNAFTVSFYFFFSTSTCEVELNQRFGVGKAVWIFDLRKGRTLELESTVRIRYDPVTGVF